MRRQLLQTGADSCQEGDNMRKPTTIIATLLAFSALAVTTRARAWTTGYYYPGTDCFLVDGGNSVAASYNGTYLRNTSGSSRLAICPIHVRDEATPTYYSIDVGPYGGSGVSCTLCVGGNNSTGTSCYGPSSANNVGAIWQAIWSGNYNQSTYRAESLQCTIPNSTGYIYRLFVRNLSTRMRQRFRES
jgi:hypothetical protein